jgi:ribosome-binding protein aMBF1 (putative translation factor)
MRLGNVIADYRWANRVGVRELAKEIGISHPTLNRFERGEKCDSDTLTKILEWLFAAAEKRRRKEPDELSR